MIPASAFRLVKSISDGEPDASALEDVVEAISKGNAGTLNHKLTSLGARMSSSAWSNVYYANERQIRESLRGVVGVIESSAPKRRYGVLLTKHAPKNPERYIPEIKGSIQAMLAGYEGVRQVASSCAAPPVRATSFVEAQARASILEFSKSLAESAEHVIAICGTLLAEMDDGAMPEFIKLHDMLADALSDFRLAAEFVSRISIP